MDVGLTHIALPVRNIDKTAAFYAKYANMRIVHRRAGYHGAGEVAWLSDKTRPFVIVIIEAEEVAHPLLPFAHLGVGCKSRDEIDRLATEAEREGALISGPEDWGAPVGYWAFLRDPDGHTLELSFGQEVALTVAARSEN